MISKLLNRSVTFYYIIFSYFSLMKSRQKSRLYNIYSHIVYFIGVRERSLLFSTSGFCHATQAVRYETVYQPLVWGTWLTSAWLTAARRSKTFLERTTKIL